MDRVILVTLLDMITLLITTTPLTTVSHKLTGAAMGRLLLLRLPLVRIQHLPMGPLDTPLLLDIRLLLHRILVSACEFNRLKAKLRCCGNTNYL
jgi:hypothetical protein